MEKVKRYLVFLVGLFVNSLGVSLITRADLGTSPISSIPYVLSLNFPLTLGEFTIAFSLLLIALQLLILRKNFKLEHWLQIPISVAFGYFIDLTTGHAGGLPVCQLSGTVCVSAVRLCGFGCGRLSGGAAQCGHAAR